MAISIYNGSVAVFARMLTNLLGQLDKAEAYAGERKFKIDNLVGARLAPDMHPLSFQIQNATDRAKLYVARVTGKDAPKWTDDETTIADLRARIQKAIDYLAGFSEADFKDRETVPVPLKVRGEDVQWSPERYLLENAYPNFFFHVTTAYDILRHNGVPVGKRDFTG